MKSNLIIGTRGSALALYQAEVVKTGLEVCFPMIKVKVEIIKTSGDMIRRGGHSPLETKRIFTREIEEALLAGKVDLAVHSAKDLSAVLPEGLELTAVLEREDARDCLVSRDKTPFEELPMGARIGTGSLRRKLQLLRLNPELIVEDVRGNVETRIRKTEDGTFDAVVLAVAGIKRLGLSQYITGIFPEEEFYPSPGQGAIAVQTRTADDKTNESVRSLHHYGSGVRLTAERAFLKSLEGGCQFPCGIRTALEAGELRAEGAVFAIHERTWIEKKIQGPAANAEALGRGLARLILEDGGREILESIRKEFEK